MVELSGATKEETSEQILRFFRQPREEWRSFVSDFLPVTPHPPLQALAKFFVIRSNQPFDMQAYMKAQAEFIKSSLDGSLGSSTPLERQKLVAEWLRHNAQSHRDQIILYQARRIEQCGELVEAGLKELLEGVVSDW